MEIYNILTKKVYRTFIVCEQDLLCPQPAMFRPTVRRCDRENVVELGIGTIRASQSRE